MKKKKEKQKPKDNADANKSIKPGKPFLGYNYIIVLLFILFCFLLYKNISYPLLWNDEAETIMTAKQVIKYGYPKVHDGKNIIYLPMTSAWVGYKPSLDMNVSMTSGCYYFATISVFLSNYANDLYLKTALARIPFATIGLIGLFIFLLALRRFFNNENFKKFIVGFILIELFSVILFLNMREARYYSLVIFITSCFFYVFINYFILNKFSYKKYLLLMVSVLFFAFHINVIAFTACCLTMVIYEIWFFIRDAFRIKWEEDKPGLKLWDGIKSSLINSVPLFITAALIYPFIQLYGLFDVVSQTSDYGNFTFAKYIFQLKSVINVLETQDIFYVVIFVKVLQIAISLIAKFQKKKKAENKENMLEGVSLFMTMFFICFWVAVARMPFLFTRYYIVMQPIMVLILLTDTFIILQYISAQLPKRAGTYTQYAFIFILAFIISFNVNDHIQYFKDYTFQLTNQYKGPLDYFIPYIKDNYKSTSNLIVATNYEELSYIFYLDCIISLGYCNKNLKEDLKHQPDVIIFRKLWGYNPEYMNQFMQQAPYKRVAFPVEDFMVNNIAELEFMPLLKHQFRTRRTEIESDKAEMYVKAN